MRVRLCCIALAVGAFVCTTPAFAVDRAVQDNGSAVAAWVALLVPLVIVVVFVYPLLRRSRSAHAMAERSSDSFEAHRRFTEEHMKRVESQIERVDQRLSQVVELLQAIEHKPRAGE